ncbi:FAD dependent oxidoreductase domain containing protein [Acanthamoeba castellanii str. Neff]|uniref:FAD dependent oxidoreductase domain containing protein n=1 Tax=Acanthamoeba castellanii (strain ATCC 30010 / Neff) TaxID=1257118 RepID=L8HD88_ACACF|nr:FAD dependent oxidoreductase domain containing protein [Acanthamoeba castellanii str. Neff]ELR22361.1 FAD dependent oxidoreductase domain containing protein [Acanthamoeba castellanii str. Neff]
MTGLATAYWLRRSGVSDVLVLEQRDGLAHGATGRNGGHCWPSFTPFSESKLELYGREEEARLSEFKKQNFELIKEFIATHDVSCDFCSHGCLELARHESEAVFLKDYMEQVKATNPDLGLEWWDKEKCEQEAHSPSFLGGSTSPPRRPSNPAKEEEARLSEFKKQNFELIKEFIATHDLELARHESEAVFLKDYMEQVKATNPDLGLEWWDKEKCEQEAHSPSFLGGLYQPTAASFYPAKVVYALAREARKLGGVQIMTNTPVLDITEDQPHHYRLRTANGGEVTTSCVVHATNAWAPALALITSPISQLRWLRNLAFDDGFQYMIQREDGRIVLGGMRWVTPTKERDTLDDSICVREISEKLHEFLEENFPSLQEDKGQGVGEGKIPFRVEHEWTGIMAYSKDGAPLVGPLTPLAPLEGGVRAGQYIGAGYTGNGMANCFAAGKSLAEMISGQLQPEDCIQCLLPSRFFDDAKRREIERQAEEEDDDNEWY